MTNREFISTLPNEVLASFIACPADLYGDGIDNKTNLKCQFKLTGCKGCAERWLDSEQSVFFKEE